MSLETDLNDELARYIKSLNILDATSMALSDEEKTQHIKHYRELNRQHLEATTLPPKKLKPLFDEKYDQWANCIRDVPFPEYLE